MMTETIVITGASRGIGEAAALRLARDGRHLILLARSELDLRRVRSACRLAGAEADYLTVDLSQRDRLEEVLDTLEHDVEPIDTLVLNAGTATGASFLDTDPAEVDRELAVNYLAPTLFLRRLVTPMVRRGVGRVAVVASLTGVIPFPGNANYAATKAALIALIRSLRLELADSPVHLGVVLPGFVRTSMTSELSSILPAKSPEQIARAIERCLEHRRRLVIPGLLNNAAMRLFAALPELADRLVDWLPALVPKPLRPESIPTETYTPHPRPEPWPEAS